MQSNHATRGITSLYPQGEGVPNIVLIGVPDTAALLRVRDKLVTAQIPHYCFTEPDHDFGFTAIATAALADEDRVALRNYRLWNDKHNMQGRAGDCPVGKLTAPAPNTPVTQLQSTGL